MKLKFVFSRVPRRRKAAGVPHDGRVHAAEAVRGAGQ